MRAGLALSMTLATVLVASPALAAGNPNDVFDRPLQPLLMRHEPKLILYASQSTQDQVTDPTKAMRARLGAIPFITVVHVDLRGVPGFLMGFARRLMQGSQEKANKQNRELAIAAGLKPLPEGEETTHVVMEPDGAAHASIGLAHGFQQAMAVVLDSAGKEILRAPFPEQSIAVEKAIRDAWKAEQQPQGTPPAP